MFVGVLYRRKENMILRNSFIACLVPLLLASQYAAAQNINGFKVFVSKHRVTTLYFHDPVAKNYFAEKTAPYKFEKLMRTSNSIPLSVDKDVKEPFTLYVNEGSRQHKFIIIYKDVIEAFEQDIYFSDLKVVAAIAKLEESKQVSNSQISGTPVKQEDVNAASQQSNEKKTALKPGGFAKMPKGMVHYAVFPEETVIQIHGQGPQGITYVNPADDPRKQN